MTTSDDGAGGPLPSTGTLAPMSGPRSPALPIEPLRPAVLQALEDGAVVVSAPTGSGKSTRVPVWCRGDGGERRVLVVEPRRVACRSLAQRVAQLEGEELGRGVGYHVRDDRRAGDDTHLLYATPGIVLRLFDRLGDWDTVILDEFHERGLETDLLLALLAARRTAGAQDRGLLVMSATLAGDRLAAHLDGRHLEGEGRAHPVEVRHLAAGGRKGATLLPDADGLEARVVAALREARELPGDVLVFLPGKGEIAACRGALDGAAGVGDVEVLELHGGLTLDQQSRAFRTGGRRKVVLATNVAETSVTLPGIGVVVDSGLVRQTRWYRDRGFLSLVPIAADSAEQRKGRAGRTRPGVCFRLWGEAAQLRPRTPPEVHRETLTPLVLAAAALGERLEDLPFLDPPKEEAVAAARDELSALGALDGDGLLTERGRRIFGLPLDAALGRLLIEAQDGPRELLEDVVDLVSALAVDRPLPAPPRRVMDAHAVPKASEPALDPAHCDAVTTLATVRAAARGGAGGRALAEALSTARRLRRAFDLPVELPEPERRVERRALARVVLAADPRTVHVARRRGRRTAWAAGGPELVLARESAAAGVEGIEAVAVLATHAVGSGFRKMTLLATCALPLPLRWLEQEGFGEERLGAPKVRSGRIVARVERVWAGRVLGEEERTPRGELAREALVELFLEGRVFAEARRTAEERLNAARLALGLARNREARTAGWEARISEPYADRGFADAVPELEAWSRRRVDELGVESGDDLALLSGDDLLPPALPYDVDHVLAGEFPLTLELPDATYALQYEPARRRVTLVKTSGSRSEPPPLAFLPRLGGFQVRVRHGQMLRTVRQGR